MANDKRCARCGADDSSDDPLLAVRNPRNNPIGVYCEECRVEVDLILEHFSCLYGAVLDPAGGQVSGPTGTPDVRSLDELLYAMEVRERELEMGRPPVRGVTEIARDFGMNSDLEIYANNDPTGANGDKGKIAALMVCILHMTRRLFTVECDALRDRRLHAAVRRL
jgi:hypothetical protein